MNDGIKGQRMWKMIQFHMILKGDWTKPWKINWLRGNKYIENITSYLSSRTDNRASVRTLRAQPASAGDFPNTLCKWVWSLYWVLAPFERGGHELSLASCSRPCNEQKELIVCQISGQRSIQHLCWSVIKKEWICDRRTSRNKREKTWGC